jgi:hypothetical protein
VQAIVPRAPLYRVCVKCGRRAYQLALVALDEVHGLCVGCMERIQADKLDPGDYLTSRLPRAQSGQLPPVWRLPAVDGSLKSSGKALPVAQRGEATR